MPAQTSPIFLLAATRRRSGYADLRLSDAERAEVADLLSRHYTDGRLDQAEFDERLDQAMKAKTYRDLNGLFDDLPRTEASEPSKAPGTSGAATRRRYPHPNVGVLFLVVVIVLAAAAGHALVWSLSPWVWSLSPWVPIGLLSVIVLYATRIRRGKS